MRILGTFLLLQVVLYAISRVFLCDKWDKRA